MRDHILVVGDAALEHTISGEVVGLCPEDRTVPLLKGSGPSAARVGILAPGDAAAVAAQAATFAGNRDRVSCVTVVGRGPHGGGLIRLLSAALGPRHVHACYTPKKAGTTVRTRVYSGRRLLARVDRDGRCSGSRADLAGEVESVLRDGPSIGRIVLVDRGRGTLSARLLTAVTDYSAAHGVPILCSPRDIELRWDILGGTPAEVTMVYNEQAALNLGLCLLAEDRLAPAAAGELARRLRQEAGVSAAIVTLGDLGAVLSRRESPPRHVPGQPRPHGDPLGAGTTFLAALALLGGPAGLIDETAVRDACLAAGLATDLPGLAPVDREAWVGAVVMTTLYRRETGRVHAASAPDGSSPPPPR